MALLILLVGGQGCTIGVIVAPKHSDEGECSSHWLSSNPIILGSVIYCNIKILNSIQSLFHLFCFSQDYLNLETWHILFLLNQTNTYSPLIFLSDRTSQLFPIIYICHLIFPRYEKATCVYAPHPFYPGQYFLLYTLYGVS